MLYWKCYVTAPDSVPRPKKKHRGGYFTIWYDGVYGRDLIDLWEQIVNATKDGDLGYYSGISNDLKVIGVHNSDPNNEEEICHIRNVLFELGVIEHIKYKTQAEIHPPEGDSDFELVPSSEESSDEELCEEC